MYLDSDGLDLTLAHVGKLIGLTETWEGWQASAYGQRLKFCDRSTFQDFRRTLLNCTEAWAPQGRSALLRDFDSGLKKAARIGKLAGLEKNSSILSAFRSTAPLNLRSTQELSKSFHCYWDTGTTSSQQRQDKIPNPMLGFMLNPATVLHYGTDPILGYHLATANSKLTEASPLRYDGEAEGAFKVVRAARVQFFAWIKAFQSMKDRVVVRFVAADALAFCHTLQHHLSSRPMGPGVSWPRKQFDLRKLELDALAYNRTREDTDCRRAPLTFDVVDTSNLADHLGTLNLLIATGPLLKNRPSSTIQTETMLRREASETETFSKLLFGDGPTMSILLGLTPTECCTNSTAYSVVHESMLSAITKSDNRQLHSRLSWKLSHRFSGRAQCPQRLGIDSSDLVAILHAAYKEMFAHENVLGLLKLPSREQATNMVLNSTYTTSHRGTFASLMKSVQHTVDTNWNRTCAVLTDMIHLDRQISLSTNCSQELAAQLHMGGVYSAPWLTQEVKRSGEAARRFRDWDHIPEVVAVTLVVPRNNFNRLFGKGVPEALSPMLEISMCSSQGALNMWQNLYADVHLAFGKAVRGPSQGAFQLEEDDLGWGGSSDLIACFYAPTSALQVEPRTARISLVVQTTAQSTGVYLPLLGLSMAVYETSLGDESHVFVSKFQAGYDNYPVVCPPVAHLAPKAERPETAVLSANVDKSSSKICSITGHIDIQTQQGKDPA